MTIHSISGGLTDFLGRVVGRRTRNDDERGRRWSGRETLCGRDCRRYGISEKEANQKREDWIREPGVLDDWNDNRAILDM
jgi:hypothetical protein